MTNQRFGGNGLAVPAVCLQRGFFMLLDAFEDLQPGHLCVQCLTTKAPSAWACSCCCQLPSGGKQASKQKKSLVQIQEIWMKINHRAHLWGTLQKKLVESKSKAVIQKQWENIIETPVLAVTSRDRQVLAGGYGTMCLPSGSLCFCHKMLCPRACL